MVAARVHEQQQQQLCREEFQGENKDIREPMEILNCYITLHIDVAITIGYECIHRFT